MKTEPKHTEGKLKLVKPDCSDDKMLRNDCQRNHFQLPLIDAEVWYTIGENKEEQFANAQRMVTAWNEYDSMKKQLAYLKLSIILAIEFGYKQCEKGNNLESTFENFNRIQNNEQPTHSK